MDNERLYMIQKRKQERKRRQMIKLSIIAVAFICAAVLVITGITGAIKAVKKAIPTPSPTPVDLISKKDTYSSSAQLINLPDAAEENDILNFVESSQTDTKVCYLTFDDGPNKIITPKILDILRRYNVKATFFQVGTLIEENPDMARRVYEEGHLIGNHSYSHTYSKIYSSNEGFVDEFNKCAELIQNITGDDYFPIIRFPGGGYNSGQYGEMKQELKKILAQNNVYHCDWNALSGDAEGGAKSAEQLLERVKTSSEGKNKIVILMHDTATKKQTVNSLPAIIEYLMNEGYVFARLDQIID